MENKLYPAPFDEKNLSADALRDDVFADFYEAKDSKGHKSHMIGRLSVDNDKYYIDGYVSASWSDNDNTITIELLACPCEEDFFSMTDDFLMYYSEIFKAWECEDNENLVVKCKSEDNKLFVGFYFEED